MRNPRVVVIWMTMIAVGGLLGSGCDRVVGPTLLNDSNSSVTILLWAEKSGVREGPYTISLEPKEYWYGWITPNNPGLIDSLAITVGQKRIVEYGRNDIRGVMAAISASSLNVAVIVESDSIRFVPRMDVKERLDEEGRREARYPLPPV